MIYFCSSSVTQNIEFENKFIEEENILKDVISQAIPTVLSPMMLAHYYSRF